MRSPVALLLHFLVKKCPYLLSFCRNEVGIKSADRSDNSNDSLKKCIAVSVLNLLPSIHSFRQPFHFCPTSASGPRASPAFSNQVPSSAPVPALHAKPCARGEEEAGERNPVLFWSDSEGGNKPKRRQGRA